MGREWSGDVHTLSGWSAGDPRGPGSDFGQRIMETKHGTNKIFRIVPSTLCRGSSQLPPLSRVSSYWNCHFRIPAVHRENYLYPSICFSGTLFCHHFEILEVSEALDDTVRTAKMRSTIWDWSRSFRSSNKHAKIRNTLKLRQKMNICFSNEKWFFQKKKIKM